MAKKAFYLVKRGDRITEGKPTYYARFRTDDGTLLPWQSTGETVKTRAELWALKRIKSGVVGAGDRQTFGRFAEGWWKPEHPYVRGRLARGRRLVPTYLVVMQGYLKNHVLPYFRDRRLGAISPRQIEDWLLKLRGEGKLSAASINHALRCLKIMLREAARVGLIARDPSAFIGGFAQEAPERGILTGPELVALFADRTIQKVWDGDRLHYTLNMVAASTGLRMGELQALSVGAVRPGHLSVTRAWERRGGLREGTKTGRGRIVPVPSKVSAALNELIAASPFREPDDLVFHNGEDRKTPVDQHDILRVFYRALERIGIEPEQRGARRLVFHSYRHGLNTLLRAAKVSDALVQRVTGHRTDAMTEHYSHFALADFADVAKVQERLFEDAR